MNLFDQFKLKPQKLAKIAEISEATALSQIPQKDKVNFHIGNPIQENPLEELFFKLISDFNFDYKTLESPDFIDQYHDFEIEKTDLIKLKFLFETVKKSSPYMPQGGFTHANPNFAIKYFFDWLTKNQQEPLEYDFGTTSCKRELAILSGGKIEAVRILLHTIKNYFAKLPVNLFLYEFQIPGKIKNVSGINFIDLAVEDEFLSKLKTEYKISKLPAFILLGKIPNEKTRRELRVLSLTIPIFFVEINDSPNHNSFAREAKLKDNVIRFLTPQVLKDNLNLSSVIFAAGNSDYIKAMNSIHFRLKGTPSASEVELLGYLLEANLPVGNSIQNKSNEFPEEIIEEENFPTLADIQKNIVNISRKYSNRISDFTSKVDNDNPIKYAQNIFNGNLNKSIFHSTKNSIELFDELISNFDSEDFHLYIINNFKSAFCQFHPEYDFKNIFPVSGSARTALSLLGNNFGISKIITPDLSWTYEHCFPEVEAVSLNDNLDINIEAIIKKVDDKISLDSNWGKYGAVVFNNPHNASGKVFQEERIAKLLIALSERSIFVIDDLSYQNVSPSNSEFNLKTVWQIAIELKNKGKIKKTYLRKIITVHSLSKTDCFAGARLSVLHVQDENLQKEFSDYLNYLVPNIFAIFIAFLFYRNEPSKIKYFYNVRNKLFNDRMNSLEEALKNIPENRNTFGIKLARPEGAMYPQMIIENLPKVLSLDTLSSELASNGIGMIPLTTFSRTAKGYEIAQKSFRLTLGGIDGAEELLHKMRRVIIDINRLIAEEASKYQRIYLPEKNDTKFTSQLNQCNSIWENCISGISENALRSFEKFSKSIFNEPKFNNDINEFKNNYLKFRIENLSVHFSDRLNLAEKILAKVSNDKNEFIENIKKEFYKDDIQNKSERFRFRNFDRTVHPTQMYSIQPDLIAVKLIDEIIFEHKFSNRFIDKISDEIVKEYFGINVPVNSAQEADEAILDLRYLIEAEIFSELNSEISFKSFLSFWGDWDGSTRPSGQGHRIVAGVLIENVNKQSDLLKTLMKFDDSINIEDELKSDLDQLENRINNFWKLLNEITDLTNQLEKRYKRLLPFIVKPNKFRKAAMKLGLAKDPMISLWQHNDRLEKKMLKLRKERRDNLLYYFELNKKLRKKLFSLIPKIKDNLDKNEIALRFGFFKNLLSRFVLTPRIHQSMITAKDPFAIETTVHNLIELNELSEIGGNAAVIFAIQISMSTNHEALISLNKIFVERREYLLRENQNLSVPKIWIIPLFEDVDSVKNIENYLNGIWDFSLQSRKLNQDATEKFNEIICEIFIAGSDLSQQISQILGASLYNDAKFKTIIWLSQKGLVDKVRMKLGSGEPMQRQGGYYFANSGKKAFLDLENSYDSLISLKDSTKKSIEFATTPLLGIFSSGDLRTFQSGLSEKLRFISANERANLLYHVKCAQKFHFDELVRTSEPVLNTRLAFTKRNSYELEKLTTGRKNVLFDKFTKMVAENFRRILYGSDEDVIGIHAITYFISRTVPNLRDRPAVRPIKNKGTDQSFKVLEKIYETIPFSKQGSLLRAIGHNQAQTMILGINQLTTGLFRACSEFRNMNFTEGNSETIFMDIILTRLPVYEILHTLRIYQDVSLKYLSKIEKAFPANNSALFALREDFNSMENVIPLFQKELLRRHGINTNEFFDNGIFNSELLPVLRPDIAVLLQPNIFNTEIEKIIPLKKVSDQIWIYEIKQLLEIPNHIKFYREKIWQLFEKQIYAQTESFVELAISLNSISLDEFKFSKNGNSFPDYINVKSFFGNSSDDSLRQFLFAAAEYLSSAKQNSIEIPIDIIRSLKDVEKIVNLEKQALSINEQNLLRYYILQIARLSGENG